MTIAHSARWFVIAAFLVGFVLGGLTFHAASAEGLFGIKESVTQIGTSLIEMQKNVDELQKNMNALKQTKDKLSSLPSAGGAMDSIMKR